MNIRKYALISAIALILIPFHLHGSTNNRAIPFDDGVTDNSFFKWRNQLLSAIKNRNVRFLLKSLDNQIEVTKENECSPSEKGINAFKSIWQKKPETSPSSFEPSSEMWEVLEEITSNGAIRITPNSFRSPYYDYFLNNACGNDTGCIYGYSVLIDPDVKIYKKPKTSSKETDILSYETVIEINRLSGSFSGWSSILKLTDFKKGYIESKHLRSFGSYYTASFYKKNGNWKIYKLTFPHNIGCGG